MLKQRVMTAIVMVLVLVLVLFWLPPFFFGLALLAIFSMAAWEWANLTGLTGGIERLLYALVAAIVFTMVLWVGLRPSVWLSALLLMSVTGWGFALHAVVHYPQSKQWCSRNVLMLLGMWLLLPCFCSLLVLKQLRPDGALVVLVIASIAAADIGAYFSGRRFGRHKLAPAVSPGKTWEGVLGGFAANLLLACIVTIIPGLVSVPMLPLVLLLVATAAISVLGDLFESLVKRERGVKDSSQLLPGHGGILDRIDGWTAAFPLFTFFYMMLV